MAAPTSQRVLLIYTGGTIGMRRSDDGYVPTKGLERALRTSLDAHAGRNLPDFDFLELEEVIDSANLRPDHWQKVAETALRDYERYGGFVILHGTDTMAFTASALSFMLRGLDKPLILTGSQIPLTEPRNDAINNLVTAILLAAHYPIREVCVYFSGRLLRGNRTTKSKAKALDAFDSPNYPWLGQAGIDIRVHHSALLPPAPRQFQVPAFDRRAVTALHLYPGMTSSVVERLLDDAHIKGLLLRSYGVGNVPDQDSDLLDALGHASARGVVVVNLTQCLTGSVSQASYATGNSLRARGVVGGADLTFEAAFAKLNFLFAAGMPPTEVAEAMTRSLCGEMSEADG